MKRVRSDCGFSLTELFVVLTLMGFTLSIAYGLFQLTSAGTRVAQREAAFAREVAAPLDFAERTLSQQVRFDSSLPGVSAWRCAFYTQRSGVSQRYVIEVPSNPADNRLLVTLNHDGGTPGTPRAWSEANVNRAAGVELFEYFDHEGNLVDPATNVLSIRSVVITIVSEHEGQQFQDSRTVFLRNR